MEDLQAAIGQYDRVSLLLQGGGALGAYQAGIYEGISQAGIEINAIAGISIGALNTALIAGNPPEKRVDALRRFWQLITHRNYTPDYLNWYKNALDNINTLGKIDSLAHVMPYLFENQFLRQQLRMMESGFEAFQTMLEGQKGFFKPRYFMPYDTTPNHLSFYTTDKLRETLDELVDLNLVNQPDKVRVSVSAVNVRTGNQATFCNWREELSLDHFIASGALPPGFPAVEIDGEYYWDGGLVSNTPLNDVIEEDDHLNHLIFQVDLWDAKGQLPENLLEIDERVKDIQYSSKTRMITHMMTQKHHYTHLIKNLLAQIPAQNQSAPCIEEARKIVEAGVKNVIQLVYRKKSYERGHKDYEFSENTMGEHWESGLRDINSTFRHADWFQVPENDEIFVVHDIDEKRKKFSQKHD